MVDWIFRGLTHATHRANGKMSSVKQAELTSIFSEKQENVVRAIRQEYNILKDLSHPNIVQFLRFEDSPSCLNLFLEYVPGISVGDSLFANCRFPEELVRLYTGQIFCGLEYLHSHGIVHRDMKADNILVSTSGTCKISNFGKAERLVVCGQCRSSAQDDFWTAPEILQKLAYNDKADIWSAGCLVLEMWTGKRPWFGDDLLAVRYKIFELKLIPPITEDIILSADAIDFKNMCFVINPADRSTATLLRRHPYLTSAAALNLESQLPTGEPVGGGIHENVQIHPVTSSPASMDTIEVRKPRPRPPGGRVPPNWTVTWKCARQGDIGAILLSPADQDAADKLEVVVSNSPASDIRPLRLRCKSNAVAEPFSAVASSLKVSPLTKHHMKSVDFITPDEHGWIVQMLDGPSEDLLDTADKPNAPPPHRSSPIPPPPDILAPPSLRTLPTPPPPPPPIPSLSILPTPPPPPLLPLSLLPPNPPTLYTLPVLHTPPPPPELPTPTPHTLPVPAATTQSTPPLPLRSMPRPLLRHDTSVSTPLPYDTILWHRQPPPLPTTIRPLPPIPSRPAGQSSTWPDEQNIGILSHNPATIRLSVIPEATSAHTSIATGTDDHPIPVSPSSASSQTSLPAIRPRLLPFPRPVIVIPPRVIGESLPPQATVYKRVEDCFPRHNLAVPVIETTGSTPRGTPSPDRSWKPSVRGLTEESKKRAGQPSGMDSSSAIARKNTTKLWVTRYG